MSHVEYRTDLSSIILCAINEKNYILIAFSNNSTFNTHYLLLLHSIKSKYKVTHISQIKINAMGK